MKNFSVAIVLLAVILLATPDPVIDLIRHREPVRIDVEVVSVGKNVMGGALSVVKNTVTGQRGLLVGELGKPGETFTINERSVDWK